MQTLVKLKGDAERDPRGVAEELVRRKAKTKDAPGQETDLLGPTLRNYIEAAVEDGRPASAKEDPQATAGAGAQEGSSAAQVIPERDNAAAAAAAATASADSDSSDNEANFKYPSWPGPQNVYRMPPINWAKYQVVGPSLDKLHDEQVRRPVLGQPYQDTEEQRGERYVMAAPYEGVGEYDFSRGVDAIHPMQTRKGSRKTN
jgi:hypothetical protein